MGWLRGLGDRLTLLICVLFGGAAPGYSLQYQQHIAGRLAQAQADLQPFVSLAGRYHDGSIDKLIAHHAASSDATFRAEGSAISEMVAAVARYATELDALGDNTFADLWHLSTHAERSSLIGTWQQFEPAFVYTPDALIVALTLAAIVWLCFQGCWGLCGKLLRHRRKSQLPTMQNTGDH